MKLSKLAADFFEDRGWAMRDPMGRELSPVIELADPEDSSKKKQLNIDLELVTAGVQSNDLLIFTTEAPGVGAIEFRQNMDIVNDPLPTLAGAGGSPPPGKGPTSGATSLGEYRFWEYINRLKTRLLSRQDAFQERIRERIRLIENLLNETGDALGSPLPMKFVYKKQRFFGYARVA